MDKEACRKVGLRSMIFVPLLQRQQTVGVPKVASSRAHAFTSEDLNMLQLMSGVLSATLRDAAASDALKDSNKRLSLTNELLKTQKAQLESDKATLTTRADNDGMTGLKNHRYFQDCLSQEFERALRIAWRATAAKNSPSS